MIVQPFKMEADVVKSSFAPTHYKKWQAWFTDERAAGDRVISGASSSKGMSQHAVISKIFFSKERLKICLNSLNKDE
jgi:hypothetical protein